MPSAEMSNLVRSSSLDAQTEPVDDVDDPPPHFRETHFINRSPESGGRGTSALNRRPSQRLLPYHRQSINQHEQSQSGDISVYEYCGLASDAQGESGTSRSHLDFDPSSTTHVHQPHQQYQNHLKGRHGEETVVIYDPQQYHQSQHIPHLNPPQQQQQPFFSYTSPPKSRQSASLTSSSPDSSSFLRHPHDPRLLQAQYEASATSYDLSSDPNFSPTVGDLVPIQLQGLVVAHISQPQPPFVGFSHPDPAGPAPFIPTGDDHDFFHHHRQPGVLQFPGVYPISFMQNPELSILNAESFDDGTGGTGFRAPRSLPPGRSRALAGDESGRSRKRTKTQSTEGFEQEEEEEKKRSRGRPRLDTNDETAKDLKCVHQSDQAQRRRTQIRLAQRAYRNRKETAIQTLEKQVDQLKNNNEEMSKAFMTLYDFAVSKGMLESAPDFGRQLQATTEKFVSLARRTSEDPGKDGEVTTGQDQESEGHKSSPPSNPEKLNEKSHSPEAAQSNQVLYGGYMVDQDPVAIQQSIPRTHALAAVHTTSWAHDSQALGARTLSAQAPLGYEIVTEPTPDNASFPFGMSLESGLDTTGLFDSSGQPPSESPFSLLSAPSTYAYQERTFGRRLQRSTLERAYLLIRMPNPPPNRIAAVFGFCLLFEPRERILERVANRLSVNQNETMFNWRFPFLHLGGGGTFFDEMHNEMDAEDLPRFGKPRRPVGNQGTLEPHRQKVESLYGMGPWDAHTEEMRDARVTRTLRTSVPGFEGDFYDADEVEWVLQQRGVIIPPAADFVTADIDPADFPVSDDVSVGGSGMDNYIASTIADSNAFGVNISVGVSALSTSSSPSQGVALEATGTPTLDFIGTTASGIPTTMAMSTPMNLDPNLGGGLFSLGSSATSGTPPVSRKRTVTINVGMLVHELGSRSVCLGRSPGVRPKDVNAAFWSSLAS